MKEYYSPLFTGKNITITPLHFSHAIKPKSGQRPDLNSNGEIELSNGVWLTATGDGNYHDSEGIRWNELVLALFDEDGELNEYVYSFGFVRELDQ